MTPHIRRLLRLLALVYVAVLLLAPVSLIVWRALSPGLGQFIASITTPAAESAFRLSLLVVCIVVPVNVTLGVMAALVLTRHKFRGNSLIQSVIDLPFAVSPVVTGAALILLWGTGGLLGFVQRDFGLHVLFGTPGIALACIFATAPFVIREVEPLLIAMGTDQEHAASSLGATPWQTFCHITLPSIRIGVIYGVVLTVARTLGEYGAAIMVSSNLPGRTQTLTMLVSDRNERGDHYGAFAVATLLMGLAIVVLIVQTALESRRAHVH